jgi:hypothetical protein
MPRSLATTLILALAGWRPLEAQQVISQCDSVVAASRVDSIPVGIFVRTVRLDGPLQAGQSKFISETIASAFVAPRPFRLSVFSGAAQMRVLRRVDRDSAGELRAPTITGVYRYTTTRDALKGGVETLRLSLVPGFDSAARAAIRSATAASDVRSMAEGDADSMRVEIRFSTDSLSESFRIAAAEFPRMPVIDAVPRRDNPAPEFPASARAEGLTTGEVVLRFVVDPSGQVAPGTIEVSRATSIDFVRAALVALPAQRFGPATIRGCPVAQVVDYSFSFVLPASGDKPPLDKSARNRVRSRD